ncbi:lef-6 [Clostera anachoreta granulovirus]|uniref:Lef-6 n=1 Tax=Clostera anachoreta granulovirus TaxID=283675 RepID=F4ZKU2_9BBAC|nr:lef-6 [Clostera anachoreta granulovirus]AEB00353.1 lef-6 [Clostera anachoreta granulovirus]
MPLSKSIRLQIASGGHPLWLTKSLMLYVGGRYLVGGVDWTRSGRRHLIVNKRKAAEYIRTMRLFYPDGATFSVEDEEEESNEFVSNEFEEDEDVGVDSSVHDFWYD